MILPRVYKHTLIKKTMTGMRISKLSLLMALTFSLSNVLLAANQDLWKHIVNVDRLAWQERDGQKKINKQVDDEDFVRRIYLDITGKIPTYEQMLEFRKEKSVNKYADLIDKLLNSPGYVSHYTVFWQDLLRIPGGGDGDRIYHKEFTRYIERFLAENKPYDKIVHDLVMAEGTVEQNPAIAFYVRDKDTGVTDTFNATTRAFLGTRLGCAQCHNHRFDKWTQKEFFEASAFMHGVKNSIELGPVTYRQLGMHIKAMEKDKRWTKPLTHYQKRALRPSLAKVDFVKEAYNFPDNYIYDNAKPGSPVKERIVFDYGDEVLKGKNKREQFASWLTSKNNPMFARVFTNRIWKRVMGVANMDPVDDYKDNITMQNEALFKALGDIFVDLDYNIKDFMKVLFNTEAYLYAYDPKNDFKQDEYKVQGALLKRMSAFQLNDSLLVLRHGDVDKYNKLDPQYFEFEDRLYELIHEYKKEVFPMIRAYTKEHGSTADYIEQSIVDVMFKHLEKFRELEDYYQIMPNGYLKNAGAGMAMASQNGDKKSMNMMMEKDTMKEEGSMKYGDPKKMVQLANYSNSDFLTVFGKPDRSVTNTNLNTTATMKQLLKLANSAECKAVAKPDSYLMKNALAKEKFTDRVAYLYYSIYGRAPDKSEVKIAVDYCKDTNNTKRWSNYVIALLNSPEFYFIK